MDNEPVKTEQTNQTEPTKVSTTEDKPKKSVSVAVFIVSLILVFILGGLAGYTAGASMKEDELTKQYNSEKSERNDSADKAKSAVSDEASENQQAIAELQQQNAALQTTIDEQTKKIADLEAQLEDTQSSDTTDGAMTTP